MGVGKSPRPEDAARLHYHLLNVLVRASVCSSAFRRCTLELRKFQMLPSRLYQYGQRSPYLCNILNPLHLRKERFDVVLACSDELYDTS